MVQTHDKIDEFEAILADADHPECPLTHLFTPGLYVRTVAIPAGTWVTSKIHKTEHPFILVKGKALVMNDGKAIRLEAPYQGVTKMGTRRVVYALEDLIWTTIHANVNDSQDLLEIENRVIEPHDNELLPDELKIKYNLCHTSPLQGQVQAS